MVITKRSELIKLAMLLSNNLASLKQPHAAYVKVGVRDNNFSVEITFFINNDNETNYMYEFYTLAENKKIAENSFTAIKNGDLKDFKLGGSLL